MAIVPMDRGPGTAVLMGNGLVPCCGVFHAIAAACGSLLVGVWSVRVQL
jgi:hypothetical protein